ncbi:hypothetical protein CLG85_026150 [Yangia mangrovi]|uniref:Uncharacterized protein n=1 Tax=Alloyangia mangrovi TaxID=1779329 RepID=A0A2A3JUU4_9RHOB|nr:hypothetical protein [Alloyangia mangrovi]MCT4373589.1 hypothetical protein [Alloyangia mangrovi]
MTLSPTDAERVLLSRYGEPAKEATDYIIGFRNPVGRVLAIHRATLETRIWFQPPAPPELDGVTLLDKPNNGNSNINGPLASLKRSDTQRVEIDSATALQRFLNWYDRTSNSETNRGFPLDRISFPESFARFQDLLTRYDRPFTRFEEGLIAAWESYKPRVRELALERLRANEWQLEQIGSGEIVAKVIDAIEIQSTRGDVSNNMVFWQNRFGHANRDHRAFIEAAATGHHLKEIEQLLYDLYRGERPESSIFDGLSGLTSGKYPLIAYLFFIKDMDRFMPIQPTGFDRVFAEIGFDFRTLRACSWSNYAEFNAAIDHIRQCIIVETKLQNVRLIDAHSLLWLFSTLLKMESKGELSKGAKSNETFLGAREKSIAEIKYSVGKTAVNSNGQVIETKVKNKELRMTDTELDQLLRELLKVQQDRCAISGLPLQFRGAHTDMNMLPSLDRIDSNGHYERGNLQIVCRFINFWKQASQDGEFRHLLNVVRGIEVSGT